MHRQILTSLGIVAALLFSGGAEAKSPLRSPAAIPAFTVEIRHTPSTAPGTTPVDEVWMINSVNHAEQKIGQIATIPAHTPFFHWAPLNDAQRWLNQGHIDSGELSFLDQGVGVSGGGFYASLSPLDSSGYGPWVAVLDSNEDIRVLDKRTVPPYAVNWNELNQALSEKNIEGIWQSPTWLNFFRPEPLQNIRKPTLDEFLKYPQISSNISVLMKLETEIPVDLDRAAAACPAVKEILDGTATENTLMSVASTTIWSPSNGPLTKKFLDEMTSLLKTKIGPLSAPWRDFSFGPITQTSQQTRSLLFYAQRLGIQYSEFFPDAGVSPVDYVALNTPVVPTLTGFGKNLLDSFEFIDAEDILVAAAKGDPAPWTRYDEQGKPPLLDRWHQATTAMRDSFVQPGIAPDRTEDRLVKIFRIISAEDKGYFRDRPIQAGGDIYVGGKGYYRVTAHQKTVLEANPFLTTEFIPDPNDPSGHFLARHEYPSAATYTRFKQFLSADLVSRLDAAQAAGQLTSDSDGFKKFTQEIVEQLTKSAYQIPDPYLQYQTLMSIHPFHDYNGRSLRAFFKTVTGRPLFLWNYDLDLFLSQDEFFAEMTAGQSTFQRLTQGLNDEFKKNPGYPHYYERPELWMTGSRTTDIPENSSNFVDEMKTFYRRGDTQDHVGHKWYMDVYADLQHCDACLQKNLHH